MSPYSRASSPFCFSVPRRALVCRAGAVSHSAFSPRRGSLAVSVPPLKLWPEVGVVPRPWWVMPEDGDTPRDPQPPGAGGAQALVLVLCPTCRPLCGAVGRPLLACGAAASSQGRVCFPPKEVLGLNVSAPQVSFPQLARRTSPLPSLPSAGRGSVAQWERGCGGVRHLPPGWARARQASASVPLPRGAS